MDLLTLTNETKGVSVRVFTATAQKTKTFRNLSSATNEEEIVSVRVCVRYL